ASYLLVYLPVSMTDRENDLAVRLAGNVEREEVRLEIDERYNPEHDSMLSPRPRAARQRRCWLRSQEMCAQLTRNRLSWFVEDDSDYWNELSDRLIRYLEELDLVRERVNLVLESEQRRLSERMNRTMYLLGIITGFFLPMTFLTGLLGINVGGIPGSDSSYGFAAASLLIALIALFQWWIFRRLRWL